MYEKFFGLEKNPFGMSPDPAFLFMTSNHREAIAGLAYAIVSRRGFAVLTGEAGTGKTTVLSMVLSKVLQGVPDRTRSSVIFNPTVTPSEFLEMTMLDFGMEPPASKAQRILALRKFLLQRKASGQFTALIVDEAHKLSDDVLEEIRLLGNFEGPEEKLLQILLIGQPELGDLLDRENLRQLKQRIALRFSIGPLSAADIEKYVAHRWSKAGGKTPQPFCDAAIAQIATVSRGIPRVINALCDNALLIGFGVCARTISLEHILEAARDLCLIGRNSHHAGMQSANGSEPVEPMKALQFPIESPSFRTLERQRHPRSQTSLLAKWTAKFGFTQ